MEPDLTILEPSEFLQPYFGIWILFSIAVTAGLIWLAIRWWIKWRPLDILKERFARGEISKEEFELRRRLLDE